MVKAEQSSDAVENLKVSSPKTVAAGLPAVWFTFKHVLKNPGFWRGSLALARVNQQRGFDCPGCAWPDPDDRRAMVEFCENGAKAVADEATRKTVTPDFFKRWSVDELLAQPEYWLNAQGRLTHPMVLRAGRRHYEPIGWDDAFQMAAQALRELASPDEAVFYTSGRTSNEAAFLYQLMVRKLGTNNLPDCSNLCHESSGCALTEALGSGKGSVTLDDFVKTDLILIVGQNPGTNHPRMLSTLEEAKRAGARIITVNPLKEAALVRFRHPQHPLRSLGPGTVISDDYYQIRINGDLAFFKGLIKELLEREEAEPGTILDHAFIKEFTTGFAELKAHALAHEWSELTAGCGLEREDFRRCGDQIVQAKSIICCWAMGVTQHVNAVANIQEIVNFLLLRGNLGRPGAGVCPVRGHSNVQGDRTMGIWEKPADAFLDKLGQVCAFEPPRHHGYDVVAAIKAMDEGRVKVFMSLGGNFLSASPDTIATGRALKTCRLTIQVSTKLNRSHLVTGQEALIFPCLGRTEKDSQESGYQFVTVENSMGVVHTSEGRLTPISKDLLSEPAIVARLADAVFGPDDSIPWRTLSHDYDRIRAYIAAVVPGFENFNARIRAQESFYLPHPIRDHREFKTAQGKALFTVHDLPRHELKADEWLMMTIRSHDQYNTTVYGLDDRYRGIYSGRKVVLINPQDISAHGFVDGQIVTLKSCYDGEERAVHGFRLVAYDIPRQCLATYFPETNPLVPLSRVALKSGTPISKSVVVTIEGVRS